MDWFKCNCQFYDRNWKWLSSLVVFLLWLIGNFLKHTCRGTGTNQKKSVKDERDIWDKPKLKLSQFTMKLSLNFFPLWFSLYLQCSSFQPPPFPVALSLPRSPAHSEGPLRAVGWLMKFWRWGLPGQTGGQSVAEGGQDGQDRGSSALSETYSPVSGEMRVLERNRGSSDGWNSKTQEK